MVACYICGRSDSLQEHHIILRSSGGEKGPTVFLCPTDHAKVHATALNLESKNPNKDVPFSKEEWKKAQRIVDYIILSIRKNKNAPDANDPATIMLKFTKKEIFLLHLLKQDRGYKNLQTFLIDSIKSILKNKFPQY